MRGIVIALLLAACQFQHGTAPGDGRGSGDGPPGPDTPMPDARVDAPPDAATPGCSDTTCIAAGGTCANGTCVILAANGQPVDCPPGSSCAVSCTFDNQSCRDGMTCGTGGDCTFGCIADHSCDNSSMLSCGANSRCEIYCTGNHACVGLTIACGGNATCIYHCCGGSACTNGFSCVGTGCLDGGATCP